MFSKVALLAAVLPLVQALTWGAPPTDAVSSQQSTLTWTHTDEDLGTPFSIELDHPSLLNAIAIANNVNPGDDSITITWPILIAQDGYTLEAVNVGNISDVFATSAAFSIANPPSASLSSTSSGASSASSGAASGSSTGSSVTVTGASSSATAPGGTTRSVSATGNSASGSNTASGSSSSSPAPSSINGNGAMGVKSSVAGVLAAAAGVAVFAL